MRQKMINTYEAFIFAVHNEKNHGVLGRVHAQLAVIIYMSLYSCGSFIMTCVINMCSLIFVNEECDYGLKFVTFEDLQYIPFFLNIKLVSSFILLSSI